MIRTHHVCCIDFHQSTQIDTFYIFILDCFRYLVHIETIQTEELSKLDALVNEIVRQRKIVDVKLTTTVFQEKILYTVLIIIDD